MKKIILATTSPRRHELARIMGLDFEIVPSSYEEDMALGLKPRELVTAFAYRKAEDVAKRFKEGIVIGVDTVVVHKNKILGKPKNKEDAYRMLRDLSGTMHEVYSGVALIDCISRKKIKDFEITKVYFKKLKKEEILSYIKTGEHMDKAGSYGIQDLSSIFVRRIDGCYFNVMGFPIYNIYRNLKKFRVNVFEYERWKQKK